MGVHLAAEPAHVAYVKEFLLFRVLLFYIWTALRRAEDIVTA